MIESLVVGVPSELYPRVVTPEMQKFERVTGIKKTRRTNKSTVEMIKATLDQMTLPMGIGQVIVMSQSPDQLSPCMATQIHQHLNLPKATIAFDVNHACDGWILGMYLASRMNRNRTLLICADRLRYEPNDIEKHIFSDSVSVTVINSGNLLFDSYTDGSCAQELYCGLDGQMKMNGDKVFDFVTTKVPEMIKSFPKHDYLVPHQANLSMLKILEMRSGYKGSTLYSIEEYGNQSMNTIPTCIAMNEKALRGKTFLAAGFGAGFTAAVASFYMPTYIDVKIVEF